MLLLERQKERRYSLIVEQRLGNTSSRPILTEEVFKSWKKRSSCKKKKFVVLIKGMTDADKIINFYMNNYWNKIGKLVKLMRKSLSEMEELKREGFWQTVRRSGSGVVEAGVYQRVCREVPVPQFFEGIEGLMNRDQLPEFSSTGVKSVDDGEASPPEYSATTVAEAADTVAESVLKLGLQGLKVSRQNPISQCPVVNLGSFGPSEWHGQCRCYSSRKVSCWSLVATAASVLAPTVAKSVEKVPPPGIAKHGATNMILQQGGEPKELKTVLGWRLVERQNRRMVKVCCGRCIYCHSKWIPESGHDGGLVVCCDRCESNVGRRLSQTVACSSKVLYDRLWLARLRPIGSLYDPRQEQVVEMQDFTFKDRIQHRTFVQLADFPAVMEELVFKTVSQDKVQLCLVDQMTVVTKISGNTPRCSPFADDRTVGMYWRSCFWTEFGQSFTADFPAVHWHACSAGSGAQCQNSCGSCLICWSSASRVCKVQGHDRFRNGKVSTTCCWVWDGSVHSWRMCQDSF